METIDYPTLVLTVGLPRSGKSTWAHGAGFPVVCPDSVRLALHGQWFLKQAEPMVWAIVRIMIHALFNSGHRTVILDATNLTQERRNAWVGPNWRTRYRVFTTDRELCVARAYDSGRADLVLVIEQMAEDAEWLTEAEQKRLFDENA